MTVTTTSSFHRERDRAISELTSVATSGAQTAADQLPQTLGFMQTLAEQPSLTSLDPAQCRQAFSGLASLLGTPGATGYIEVYRPDGSVVCDLRPPGVGPQAAAKGPWFEKAIATKQPVDGGTSIDPIVKVPAMTMAIPILATQGRVGVMSVVFATGGTRLAVPGGSSKQTVVINLDPTRKIVLGTSAGAPVNVGPVPAGSWMATATANGARTLVDQDGTTRLYTEVTAANGWHVLAGVPKSVALGTAEKELRRNLILGAAVMLLVTGLGVTLERRLARPIRALRSAIEAARSDGDARAVVEGPAEIAALATSFNETIEERHALELQLSHQALHDPLTQLPNRALLDDRLGVALDRRRRGNQRNLAVLFFDIDRFKVINDSYGHERGDQVLVAVGERLNSEARPGDTVARFGGDEFVVLADNIATEAQAATLARRLQAAVERPLELGDSESHVTATVGIALATPAATAGSLLRDADAAMYRGKERRRGTIEIFDEALGVRARARAETEADLRSGLARGEFIVVYQPEVEVTSGKMTGVEALVRWARPDQGIRLPGEFIPIAEETGMILELGDFVLETACRQLVDWQADGLDLTVSVNLSPRQLVDPKLPARVKQILKSTGAPASQLVMEMTESALVEDDPRTMGVLAALKAMGVRLALDDFGTGYASLSYLRSFPVDVVKVDRSFTGDLGQRKDGAAIVAAVLAMGNSLGLVTVAEGVEKRAQLTALDAMGCAHVQGFYLSKPTDADTIRDLAGRDLRDRRRARAKVGA